MDERPYNVLLLRTGILAEVLIDHWGKEWFRGYNADSIQVASRSRSDI